MIRYEKVHRPISRPVVCERIVIVIPQVMLTASCKWWLVNLICKEEDYSTKFCWVLGRRKFCHFVSRSLAAGKLCSVEIKELFVVEMLHLLSLCMT